MPQLCLALQRAEAEWSTYGLGEYTVDDMAVFRRAFAGLQQSFLISAAGIDATRRGIKYILISRSLMPEIARVDERGMAIHGQAFTWSPEGAAARRRAATSGRGPAGLIRANPSVPPFLPLTIGSWEEYPFASLSEGGAGAHVDKVPISENWRQGGFIRAAAMIQRFTPSNPVSVHIVA